MMTNYELKFIILKSSPGYQSKERVVIGKYKHLQYNWEVDATLGILVEKKEFNPNQDIIMIGDTESYQLRPKAIYRNSKGILYYKDNGYKYLTNEQMEQANEYIEKVKGIIEALNK